MANSIKGLEHVEDESLEQAAGGKNISYLVCCTCGSEIEIKGPMTEYYNRNICPKCKGRLKTW